ncbi:MAG TPA: RIO1 family regulatory kinase/ATPase [Marmoricola sp.]|nr:RIO1 family regulatory kinase/ATPase [Marmoricola sp.]
MTYLPGDLPDPDFTCTFVAYDDPADGQRQTRYWDLEPLMRGPQPAPDWLVTDRAALETDLGVLKTGKEADVFLLERAVPGQDGVVLAAKRYRSSEHRNFHRKAGYTEGRRTKDSREARAIASKSAFGRQAAAGQWAWAEWESLQRCYEAGVPVPYPVQIDGTEILMELVTAPGGDAAPRLATTRPERDLAAAWFDQLSTAMRLLAERGFAHGDLSPYNILVAGEQLVIIDVPQMVDLVANPQGADFLLRDCQNVCSWFARRGLEVDQDALFADLMSSAW